MRRAAAVSLGKILLYPALLLLTTAAAATESVESAAAEPSHGELLYENHCTGCHTSIAHRRENHRAKSAADVNAWVRRWATELNLGWSNDDVEDVTRHLIRRYYKFESQTGISADEPRVAQTPSNEIAPSIGCPE